MTPLLGCIADDLTGATDLALLLCRGGMRTILLLDTPVDEIPPRQADAVVVALKIRTTAPEKAIRKALDALDWLRSAGARHVFFKYCSTFDSTERGNIGPVAEALAEHLQPGFTVFCPAFPANGRTVYQGHLFVGDRLLSESSLAKHPLTPMTDPDLVRVLQSQCAKQRVGLIPLATVERGRDAVRASVDALLDEGIRFGIADALDDDHLATLADAFAAEPLLTGGSAIAGRLPAVYRAQGSLDERAACDTLDRFEGPVAVLSGSCSETSRRQVEALVQHCMAIEIDPLALARGEQDVAGLLARAEDAKERVVLYYSTAEPGAVAEVQRRLGRWEAGELIEQALGAVAKGLVERGFRKLIVAGGETSGSVARALGLNRLRVGPEIDPGVPWMQSLDEPSLLLAFKSGNFGSPDFFIKAAERVA